MQSEQRAAAERIWAHYTDQAERQRLLNASNPPLLGTTGILLSDETFLRLAAERDYWRGIALDQFGVTASAKSAEPEEAKRPSLDERFRSTTALRTEPAPHRVRVPAPSIQPMCTPERLELLRKLWPDTSLSVSDIAKRLNELPGPEIKVAQNLRSWARKMGLPTARQWPAAQVPNKAPAGTAAEPAPARASPAKPAPDASRAKADTAAPEPAPSQARAPAVIPTFAPSVPAEPPAPAPDEPAPAPTPSPAEPPKQTLPRLPITKRDEWEEAKDLLAAGMSVVQVAEEMDLPKSKVSELKFQLLREREDARRSA